MEVSNTKFYVIQHIFLREKLERDSYFYNVFEKTIFNLTFETMNLVHLIYVPVEDQGVIE